MAFNFGAPAGGFGGFGAPAQASTPAPAGEATANAPAPTGGFSFGSSAAAPSTSAPAGGVPFGGSSTTAPASTNSPAPGTSFSFGGASSSSTPAPSPGGFDFGSSASAPSASAPAGTPATTTPTVKIPDFDAVFAGHSMYKTMKTLATRSLNPKDPLAGQELMHLLTEAEEAYGKELLQSPALHYTAPNQSLRQQLSQRPTVDLNGQEAVLTPTMLAEVLALADDLRVGEEIALTLYAEASLDHSRRALAADVGTRLVPAPAPDMDDLTRNVPLAARELYFYEKRMPLQTLLMLFQRRLHEQGQALVEATNTLLRKGLVKTLVEAVRTYTKQIDGMVEELSRRTVPETTVNFVAIHAQFAMAERQRAAEILYYIGYHTQLLGDEVASLIDLVRDLSNDLPILDPVDNVPSVYEADEMAAAPRRQEWMGSSFTSALPPRKEKGPLAWEKELIEKTYKTGQPQRLRCISILTVAVVASLDAEAVLVDRETSQPNAFGVGNALLPPGSSSTEHLGPIHGKLTRTTTAEWKRPDILGVLMAAYALLLRSAPSALASPSSGSGSSHHAVGHSDIRKSCRECLGYPTKVKSLTFARLGMLPALDGAVSGMAWCDTREFFLSTFARFAARYLEVLSGSGDMPISRSKWLQDAEEDLRLKLRHQEQQQQFHAWSGTRATDTDSVPTSVDLLLRPDCADDVIAFASASCFLGPEYAMAFWSLSQTEAGASRLGPSRALRELELMQDEDDSLLPSYLAFLSGLALADAPGMEESGAAVIHKLLSSDPDPDIKHPISWDSLLETSRWFVKHLNSQDSGRASVAASSSTSSSASSYYYSYEGQGSTPSSAAPFGTPFAGKDAAPIASKAHELSKSNTFHLLSRLSLMSRVAERSPAARIAIVSSKLPIRASDTSEVLGQDSALVILFTLVATPLTSEVRGAVFNTIASLLLTDGIQDQEQIQALTEAALTAWDLLEDCQVIPIYLLDQFPGVRERELRNISGLSFPPSSTAMVKEEPGKCWIPAKSEYSILFEMEYIEAVAGAYPATEGFLRLLSALFSTAGSPAGLGRSWRPRTGCSPYIEYVVRLVLPRAFGKFQNFPPLPFRSKEHKNRLLARAFGVAEVTLAQYDLVQDSLHFGTTPEIEVSRNHEELIGYANSTLGQASLARTVVVQPKSNDHNLFKSDFSARVPAESEAQEPTRQGRPSILSLGGDDRSQLLPAQHAMAVSVPRAKSPGLTTLVHVLSSRGESFLLAALAFLSESGSWAADDGSADVASLSRALFNATQPAYGYGKSSRKSGRASTRHHLLKPLSVSLDAPSYEGARYWREKAIISALTVLCAAIVREEALLRIVDSLPGRKLIPVLRFESVHTGSTRLIDLDLQISRLSQLMMSSNAETGVLCSVTELAGYTSWNEDHEVRIAGAALSLLIYTERNMSKQFGLADFFRNQEHGRMKIASVLGNRFATSSARVESESDSEIVDLILSRMLADLRSSEVLAGSLAENLLGLPTRQDGAGAMATSHYAEHPTDCFDGLLGFLLGGNGFASGVGSSIGARAFEIFYRLLQLNCDDERNALQVSYAVARLRAVDFWTSQLTQFLGCLESDHLLLERDANIVHSIAWVLKCLSSEFDERLLSTLFDSPTELVARFVVRALPLERVAFTVTTPPSEEAVRHSTMDLVGPPEVVNGYKVIDVTKLLEISERQGVANKEAARTWAEEWNLSIGRDCASAHLSHAVYRIIGTAAFRLRREGVRSETARLHGSKLLATILRRMTSTPDLDEQCFTTATRNLALATLVSAEIIVAEESSAESTEATIDVTAACVMLAQAIVSSGSSQDGRLGSDDGRKNERTAILCSALSLLLRAQSNPSVATSDFQVFLAAASVLGHLACDAVTTSLPVTPSYGARMARCCLKLMIDVLNIAAPTWTAQALIPAAFSRPESVGGETCIQCMIRLLGGLDWDIAPFLQELVLFPSGAETLLDSRIFEALNSAAVYYQSEEAKVTAAETGPPHRKVEIEIPSFLSGHLQLMSSLLALELPDERLFVIAIHTMSVLKHYRSTLERLVARFPVDGDDLATFTRCFSQVKAILRIARPHARTGDAMGRSVDALASPLASFERIFADLALQIAENPLPPDLLPLLPAPLRHGPAHVQSHAVHVTAGQNKTWWTALGIALKPPNSFGLQTPAPLTEEILSRGAAGAEILRNCLSIFAGAPSSAPFSSRSLGRSICQCQNAIQMIQFSSNQKQGLSSFGERFVTSASKHETKLLSFLGDALEALLVILLTRAHEVQRGDYHPELETSAKDFCQTVVCTLDYSRLEHTGIKAPEQLGDENRPDYVIELVRALQKVVESMH